MKGCILFAFNNDAVDYLKLASGSARRINEFLDLPVCVVTDNKSLNGRSTVPNIDRLVVLDSPDGDNRFLNGKQIWKNRGRHLAYDLSPWDQTLLLDVDYLVNSNQLSVLFQSAEDFLCHRSVVDVTDRQHFLELNTFGQIQMPHAWATVCYFTKKSKEIFNLVQMIEENYRHYANVCKFTEKPYRNDYAFSIALHIVSSQNPKFVKYIPWHLPTSNIDVEIIDIDKEKITLKYSKKFGDSLRIAESIVFTDLHVMNKANLEKIYEK